ncbi:large conductance mechanosensitive channel protein MscL [Jatrophihabitans sp. YIM 134969]
MLKGFRDFIMRGNVVELAIAVVIGTAFQAVVSGVVKAIIQPLVNSAGGTNVNGLGFSIRHGNAAIEKSTFIDLSSVINAIIAFLVTAAVVYFLIVMPMNKIQERRAAKAATGEPDPTPKSEDIILLEQIRDLLKEGGGRLPTTSTVKDV